MALCNFGDVVLRSDFPLEITTATRSVPDHTLSFCGEQRVDDASACWYHSFKTSSGKPWLSLAKLHPGYLLRFHDLIDFLVSADGKQIRGYAAGSTPDDTIRHLFLDQVMPRLLSQLGRIVLHAGAVVTPRGAIAFLGGSGSGKSTLTASLCQHDFAGITDDCLLLKEKQKQLFAVPTYAGLRLWPDTVSALFGNQQNGRRVAHYTQKVWLSHESSPMVFSTEPVQLHRVFVLTSAEATRDPAEVSIAPMTPQEAICTMFKTAFRLDLTDKSRLEQELDDLSRLALSRIFWRLTVPRNFRLLPKVREAILDNLDSQD